ncbi:MAG TPA: protein kinase [Thermoanaerobaculia bacterium]
MARIGLEGTKLGRFEVLSLLGRGGMGEVYDAVDPSLGRHVALKILPPDLAADQRRLARFIQEARAASALNHPNLVSIYEIGSQDDVHFIAMEKIDGSTLAATLSRDKLPLRRALDIVAQVGDAIAAAHAAGITHRDLKPANIMLSSGGHPKVLDFGLAKLREAETSESAATDVRMTQSGVILGTAGYMSPEQALGKPADHRADIFSLGCILYEAVSGQRAFVAGSSIDTLHKVINDDPAPIRDAPPELQRIVRKAMAKDPNARYQSAREMAIDLRDLMRQIETPSRRSIRPILIGATVAAIAIAAIVIGVRRSDVQPVADRQVAGVPLRTLAVLPFKPMSPDARDPYLELGIADTLITKLSSTGQIIVRPTSAVRKYMEIDQDPVAAGRELKADTVLDGSIQRLADRIRVTVRLVRVSDSRPLWAGQYDDKFTDLFALEDSMTQKVAAALALKLSNEQQQRSAKHYTDDSEAYDLYLRGRYYLTKSTLDDTRKGIEYFKLAIDKDPRYALAYSGLADGYILLGQPFIASGARPKDILPRAKAAAIKALEIDDSLGQAHFSLGHAMELYDWDWAGAEREFKRAIELTPQYPWAHFWYAEYLRAMGRLEDSLAETTRGKQLDPLDPWIDSELGYHFMVARQYDRAIAEFQKAIAANPSFGAAYGGLGWCYEKKKMYPEAIAAMEKEPTLSGGNDSALSSLGHVYAVSGRRSEAQKILSDLQKRSKRVYVSPCLIAYMHLGLGDADQAIAWLEKGYEERDPWMIWLKSAPQWDDLRSDKRFQDLLRRIF